MLTGRKRAAKPEAGVVVEGGGVHWWWQGNRTISILNLSTGAEEEKTEQQRSQTRFDAGRCILLLNFDRVHFFLCILFWIFQQLFWFYV